MLYPKIVLQVSLGYIIGGNLYPGGLHCYVTQRNGASHPKGGRPVWIPRKAEPAWLSDLKQGQHEKFDAVECHTCHTCGEHPILRIIRIRFILENS